MHEGAPKFGGEHEAEASGEKYLVSVSKELKKLVAALPEAHEVYGEVTLPNGDTMPTDGEEPLERLAKVQLLRAGIEDLIEQLGYNEEVNDKERYEREKLLGLAKMAVERLEAYFEVHADLAAESKRVDEAGEVSSVIQKALALLFSSDKAFQAGETKS